jgi:hypothetical protein
MICKSEGYEPGQQKNVGQKNMRHEPGQQKNVGQKNEDRTRFDRYFSASHFSAFRD